ncbi:MAG: hypothetical protein ACOVP7_07560 [Lacibacter sp.]
MGLSIHFSGTLTHASSITALSNEVMDICNSLEWEYQQINTSALNGIVFTAPECEPFFLTFTAEGRLFSPLQTGMEETYRKAGLDASLIYWSSVKTQYAGITIHKALIELLRYISRTYFKHFELKDEGLYWETNDEAILKAQFDAYERTLQAVTDALSGMKKTANESTIELAARIEEVLKQISKRNKLFQFNTPISSPTSTPNPPVSTASLLFCSCCPAVCLPVEYPAQNPAPVQVPTADR